MNGPAIDPLIGTEIGRYTITRAIGVGGMGAVYLAEQKAIGSRVAVKVLSDQCSRMPDLLERFFAEAKAVNLIRHENIVSVIDLAQLPDGRPYIVMEFVEGQTLGEAIRGGQRAPLGGIVRAMAEVLSALEAAHAIGIIHRDLKPDNILITAEGHAKVLDFGIAKLAPGLSNELSPRTRTGALLGTPAYMAPEQISGAKDIDARSDIYAAGIVLFEAVTGRVPFAGENLFELMRAHLEEAPPKARSLRPDLPPAIEAVIDTALAKRPDERFASAAAMSAALDAASRALPDHEWRALSAPRTGAGIRPSNPNLMRPSLVRPARPTAPPSIGGHDATALGPPPGSPRAARPSAQPLPEPAPQPPVGSQSGFDLATGRRLPAPPPPAAPAPAPSPKRRAPLIIGLGVALAGAAVAIAIVATRDPAPMIVGDLPIAPSPEPIAPGKSDHRANDPRPPAPDDPRPGGIPPLVIPDPKLPPITTTTTPPTTTTTPTGVTQIQTGGISLTVPADYDPKNFDPIAYLPKARALARRLLSDAELTEFEMYENVRPNGVVDLTIPSDHDSYFEFRSAVRSVRPTNVPTNLAVDIPCRVVVEVHAKTVEVQIRTSETCNEVLRRPPRCTLAQVWELAKKEDQVPTGNVAATIGFLHDGMWFFDMDGVHSYKDCK